MRLSFPTLISEAHFRLLEGHEIVATIAQMYLHPSTLRTVCEILDLPGGGGKCHMANVATWADRERMKMRWSGPLHYANAVDDFPSKTCAFPGTQGWAGSKGGNVLDAIKNVTGVLEDWVGHDASDGAANEALKFLIHFMGDMHQPLHLAGRERGGNGIPVLFDRRHTSEFFYSFWFSWFGLLNFWWNVDLHSVWDNFMLAKSVRNVPRNYTRPLPYPQVERALKGTIYDPFIRHIMWEGVLNPWAEEIDSWLDCPAPEAVQANPQRTGGLFVLQDALKGFSRGVVRMMTGGGVEISPDGEVACPYAWAKPIHPLNCEIIWPKELDDPKVYVTRVGGGGDEHNHDHSHEEELEDVGALIPPPPDGKNWIQLDTPEYAGVVAKRMILERLLAQGGIRLAGLLNYLFADEEPLVKSLAPVLR